MKGLSLYDESYIYMNQGKSVIDRAEITLDSPVDGERLREAVEQTIVSFPRFKSRACIDSEGHMQLEDNDAPLPVFPDDGKVKYLGSADTNGYLFLAVYAEDRINFTFFHALGDGAVCVAFVNQMLVAYLRLIGREIDDEGRITDGTPEGYADELDVSAGEYMREHGIELSEEDALHEPNYIEENEQPYFKTPKYMARRLTFPYSELLAMAKRVDASPATIMMDILAQAFMDCKNTAGLPLKAVYAINLRGIFKSGSQHNFATDAEIMYPESIAASDAAERYSYIAGQMKLAMREERLLKNIFDNVATVQMMKQYLNLKQYERIEAITENGQKERLASFYLSSMGRAPIAKDVLASLKDLWMYGCPVRPLTDFYGGVYGDTYHLIIADNYTDQSILDRIGEKLGENGITVSLGEAREITPDLVDPAKFTMI